MTAPVLSGAIETLQTIGTSSTDGIMLYNSTAATSSVAQWSPRLHFEGQGYGSSATKAVDFIQEVQPGLNGATAITGNLVWSGSTGGGAYGAKMTLTSGGSLGIGTTTPQSLLQVGAGEVQVGSSGASCSAANAGAIRYNGGVLYYCDNASTWESVDSSGGTDAGDYFVATQTATATSGQGVFGGGTTLGAIITGYGSTSDVTLQNRSGGAVLEIPANTTTAEFLGNVGVGTAVPGATFTVGNNAFEVNSSGTVLAGTWQGTSVALGYGGTGGSSAATGLSNLIGNPASGNYAVNCTSGTSCANVAMASAAVTTFSAGTTGFTPNSATAGAITLGGSLNIANGGTGSATAPAYSVFANNSSGTAAPSYVTAPVLSGAIETLQTIGTSSTDGIMLYNSTAATSSVAQWSPRLHFEGQGYGSSATKAVDFIQEVQPGLNGASAITGNLVWSGSTGGGAYGAKMTLTSGGSLGIGTTTPQSLLQVGAGEVQVGSSGASCSAANAGAIRYNGGVLYYCDKCEHVGERGQQRGHGRGRLFCGDADGDGDVGAGRVRGRDDPRRDHHGVRQHVGRDVAEPFRRRGA